MYLISVDFAEAFDSIQRSTLIFALKKYKIHPQIIHVDVIAQIYSNDQTHIYFNNMFQCDIDVTSGIRQGCTGSSNLFLLITYIIIEKLYIFNIFISYIIKVQHFLHTTIHTIQRKRKGL